MCHVMQPLRVVQLETSVTFWRDANERAESTPVPADDSRAAIVPSSVRPRQARSIRLTDLTLSCAAGSACRSRSGAAVAANDVHRTESRIATAVTPSRWRKSGAVRRSSCGEGPCRHSGTRARASMPASPVRSRKARRRSSSRSRASSAPKSERRSTTGWTSPSVPTWMLITASIPKACATSAPPFSRAACSARC